MMAIVGRRRAGRARLRAVAVGGALLAVGLAGCYPAAASSQGSEIGSLALVFVVGGVVVATIVWGLTTWAIVRYRRRDDRLPTQTSGSTRVEIVWTAIPLITVLVLFGLTFRTMSAIDAVAPGGVDLKITAFRWQWAADYPASGVRVAGVDPTALEIVLPVDTPIHVTLESLDVNHAWFVPKFLFKRDAIPGTPTTFDLRIVDQGTYPGACAEFCGIGHPQMLFTIRAVDEATFEAWLRDEAAAQAAGSPVP